MSKILTFELQDEIYEVLQQMAKKSGRPVEELALKWLAQYTPRRRLRLTDEEAKAAEQRFRSHFGAVSSGNPRSADNEQIDADLMEEYASTHEEKV